MLNRLDDLIDLLMDLLVSDFLVESNSVGIELNGNLLDRVDALAMRAPEDVSDLLDDLSAAGAGDQQALRCPRSVFSKTRLVLGY
jgi:hypothetical protein